ncbi:MFS transporter [Pseudoruegeria sp. SK021]|uniref:MFS transporter n=1 Tax=Pseudoruegeria sp. SK021 TaxID=1933035 RepID=UPI000A235263|nr:MFS transporter [Pseudoruegeria sp. SK021]OSP54544.1 MFS transporter [Pseudoruegeria sp. SK021]
MSTLHPHTRHVALLVAMVFFMQLLNSSMVLTSLPQIAEAFGVAPLDVSLGVAIYTIAMATFVPFAGWLADQIGARRVFGTAILIFCATSIACGLSQSLTAFVVARALQGIASAMITPVGRIVVLNKASKSELLDATALVTWPALFAPVIGPVLGGAITTYASWRWNFFINVPIGLLALVIVPRLLSNDPPATRRRFDIPGFLLIGGGLCGTLIGLQLFATLDGDPLIATGVTLTGAALCALAIRHFHRTPAPLLGIGPFATATFRHAAIHGGLAFRTITAAMPFLLPLYFQIAFGLSPVAAGSLILVYFLGNLGMKAVTSPLLRRFGFRTVLVLNGIVGSASIAGCALLSPVTPSPLVMAVLLLAGLTRSMQFTALNTLAFADIGPEHRSAGATWMALLQQVSMSMGIVIGTAVIETARLLHGGNQLSLADFHLTFVVLAVVALVASLSFQRLSLTAGSDVSGHGVKAAPNA